MGWLQETYRGVDVDISDEGVGAIEEAVHAFVQHYEDDLGRRPTLAEFLGSLQHVLGCGGQEFFVDLEERRITGIRATTAKAKRRQQFEIGDYFVIPLARDEFAYGRVLYHAGAGGYVVEVYDIRTKLPITAQQLFDRPLKVVFARHVWAQDALANGRWRVMGHQDIPIDFTYPCFYLAAL